MKEANGVGKCVLDQHAPGIASDQLCGGRLAIVGEENGRLLVAEISDEERAEAAPPRTNLLLEHARSAIFAMRNIESDGAPGGRRQSCDLLEQFARTPPQGHEGDACFVEAIEPLVGRELGVEHEELRHTAVLAGPEIDEAEDLVSFLTLTDVGVRVAEDLTVGILGKKGQDAWLAAGPPGAGRGLRGGGLATVR